MQQLHQSCVGDQEASNARIDGAQNVFESVAKLVHSTKAAREKESVRAAHGAANPVLFSRSDEQAHFESLIGTDTDHLVEFGASQQHGAAALGGPMDRHLERASFVNHGS
jgi:hypothetical protein